TDNNNDKLIIRESSGNGFNYLISNILVGQDISDIKIYLGGGRYNLVVGLNVTNAHTNLDTLYVKDFRGGIPTPQNINGLPVPGPFTNRRLYYTSMSLSPNLIYGENVENIGCNLNRLTNNLFGKQFLIQNSKVCGDTVYVNLDIR
ncbi:MAG: hypothetical protein LH615_02585, partial [Ferruginibacter sp.]|nr:hypothetical protein [Ferruginibacter sp.]